MAKSESPFRTVSIGPLFGAMDVRSSPADLEPGDFRLSMNWEITSDGKRRRRGGFAKAFADHSPYTNFDHHRQGDSREPIVFGFEFTSGDGTRMMYDGTQSRISRLDEATGLWTDVVTGKGAPGARWSCATLQDQILFVNNLDEPLLHDTATGVAAAIPELQNLVTSTATLHIAKSRVVASFNGVLMLMNVVQDGKRYGSRIIWSKLNAPDEWRRDDPASVAGQQDLPYGDEILAAVELLGALFIFTRRAIWRCNAAGSTSADIFTFTRVYTEPENQTGCLAYPYTLVSTGTDLRYLGRDGAYVWKPTLEAPEREAWLHKSTGLIFSKADTKMSGRYCDLPIAKWVPGRRELWFSWPIGNALVNGRCLAANLDFKTCDLIDHGITTFLNFRETPEEGLCNEQQAFMGVSASDYCWKQLGDVFYREMATLAGAVTVDLPAGATYTRQGYYSRLVGEMPLGLYDREKVCRRVGLDDAVVLEANPGRIKLRVGNSYQVTDPVDEGDTCTAVWQENIPAYSLACPDGKTVAAMKAKGQKPAIGREFAVYEQNKHLYYDLRVESAAGTAPVGCDYSINRIDLDAAALPK